jgi:GT2 family glycosyltransferase
LEPQDGRDDLVSVVVPTYHRPDDLSRCVASVLEQGLPAGWELELIIAVSDKNCPADLDAAGKLTLDPRVKVVVADRAGPAAARNAGIRAAMGRALAFIDDDCAAGPDWLKRGLSALSTADLVQGSTKPAGPVPPLAHSISVDPPSWLWEACNLMVSRDAIARAGLFNEEFNPTGQEGGHFGEDIEWGWRLIRAGARPAFVPDARVEHVVTPRDLQRALEHEMQMRFFPRMMRDYPEIRKHFFLRYFVNRRHVSLTGIVALLAAGGVSAARGKRTAAEFCTGIAIAAWLRPEHREEIPGASADERRITRQRQVSRVATIALALTSVAAQGGGRRVSRLAALGAFAAWAAPLRHRGRDIAVRAALESAQFFPLIVESVRQRRIFL